MLGFMRVKRCCLCLNTAEFFRQIRARIPPLQLPLPFAGQGAFPLARTIRLHMRAARVGAV
ncbi:hypothetical protein AB838_16560 [Rhodobacteraceae bacterium (ex Bugula neritina AB1)]|nr:hypothetical protein AB838_16560 [Rhodobacteraceae bacterium (ex Bugula neritina AB1)]